MTDLYKTPEINVRHLGEPEIDHQEKRYIKVNLKFIDMEFNQLFDSINDPYPGWNVGRIYWGLIDQMASQGLIEITYTEMTPEEIEKETN